jgi:Tol biopolymer transport system component
MTLTCTSKLKVDDESTLPSPPDAAEIRVKDEIILIEDGDNAQPSFSEDGSRLLFVSAKRPTHALRQVYERDNVTKIERRITFQNGSTSYPRYQPKAEAILYASTTDEEKENPPLLNFDGPKSTKLPDVYLQPSELYLHNLTGGLNIQRLTSHSGFDGEARFSADGKQITFTRVVKEHTQILQLTPATGTVRALTGLGENPTDYVVSADGKMSAWIEWDQSFGVSRLRLRRGKETVDVAPDMIVTKSDTAFSPDSKFLLWAQKDAQTGLNGIWSFELRTNCLQHFAFSSEGDRSDPTVSPDMKFLTYTLVSRGRSRIAQVPFEQRSGPCPVIP